MEIKNMKNIVILKDLPSNMIDEAFVILKENVKIHNMQKTNKDNSQESNTKINSKKDNSKSSIDIINSKDDKDGKNVKDNINNVDEKDKGYLIKEAEMIVKEYADSLSNKNQNRDKRQIEKLQEKCAKFKAATIFLGGFSLICLINYIISLF